MIQYEVPEDHRLHWEAYLRADIERKHRSQEQKTRNRQLLGFHGEQAVMELVASVCPSAKVADANDMVRKNNPGYDIIVNDRLRIQAKSVCRCEFMDMCLPPLDHNASWASDLWIVVNFGGLVDSRVGRYRLEERMAATGRIDFYIAKTEQLRQRVRQLFHSAKRPRFRALMTHKGAQSRTKHDYQEIFQYLNRIDLLKAVLTSD